MVQSYHFIFIFRVFSYNLGVFFAQKESDLTKKEEMNDLCSNLSGM